MYSKRIVKRLRDTCSSSVGEMVRKKPLKDGLMVYAFYTHLTVSLILVHLIYAGVSFNGEDSSVFRPRSLLRIIARLLSEVYYAKAGIFSVGRFL